MMVIYTSNTKSRLLPGFVFLGFVFYAAMRGELISSLNRNVSVRMNIRYRMFNFLA